MNNVYLDSSVESSMNNVYLDIKVILLYACGIKPL